MARGLIVLSEMWRYRKELVLPTLLVPLVWVGVVMGQPPRYEAEALLQVDAAHARSPLLNNMLEPGHATALQSMARGTSLLADTARDAGVPVDGSRVKLEVENEHLLTLGYSSGQEAGLAELVDALAYNFIYEVLAPERLRLEQRLGEMEQQLKQLRAARATAASEDDTARLALQEENLTRTYADLMNDMAAVNAAFSHGSMGGLIWVAQPAQIVAKAGPLERIGQALGCGALGGLLLGLLLVAWQQARPRGVPHVEALSRLTQLPVAGALPDMGDVTIHDGKAEVSFGPTLLDPTAFSEVSRLHRTLTRGLHGALVTVASQPREGTTLLATLLALKSAASGKRTLLVDLNLRHSGITAAFGLVPRLWGLKPAGGRAKAAFQSEAIAVGAGAHGLDILPVPMDQPTLDALNQGRGAAALFDLLSSTYEHIIVDTSPLVAHNRHNADPVLLAAAANRTAMVTLMRRTPAQTVKDAADAFATAGAQLVGMVANNQFNPSPRMLLTGMARGVGRFAPGLAGWIRAKAAGVE